MGFPIISTWKKSKKQKSIDIHLVEKKETSINLIKKNNIKASIYKNVPINWKGDIIFLAVKPQDFYKVAREINKNNISFNNIVSIMAGLKTSTIRSHKTSALLMSCEY